MKKPRVVLDTNVLVSALRSRGGASNRLLSLVGRGVFELCLSVPLVIEYEDVLGRPGSTPLSQGQVDDLLDYLCAAATRTQVHYLWRPFLRDPKDDLLLELAVASKSRFLITFNTRDFGGVDRFGVEVCRPRDFLATIGALP